MCEADGARAACVACEPGQSLVWGCPETTDVTFMIYALASLSVVFVGFLLQNLIREQTRLSRIPVRAVRRTPVRRHRRSF